MINIPEIFGSLVFNDDTMRVCLPKDIYKSLHKTIEEGGELDITLANVVARAMKDWAIEKGATHYTHWFQPMTGITAEKHDSFISPQPGGRIIMEFSGKELIKGEPDASSFPSGGLRTTFEARGYTAWDPTSYAFIKDNSLCIPTVFCAYGGQVLDKKTPLLRSMELINEQSLRILRLFGDTETTRVIPTVGPEQEYFLIDKTLFSKRKDLVYTGRTLFGAKPPKGQDLGDHYFGVIRPRVMAFMKDLNEELWKLGVYAKTQHNEVAPAQHELAPVYTTLNIATDQNQLTMEIMKKIADKHNLTCLLHEKPFEGVNGSGKHNNWSLSTSSGKNIFKPGKHPYENKLFLLFLTAVIKAVDTYQDLLRISVASPGNDHRLGSNEAPPAIISIFLGDELTHIINSIILKEKYQSKKADDMHTGVNVLPEFRKDTTDRNRTSPLAFTGNKFEFRMLGSAHTISDANIVLNTIVADVLSEFATFLEGKEDFETQLYELIRNTLKKHKRILFDGNNYSEEWIEEAKRRGLLNLKTTADAVPYFIDDKNIRLFKKHKIYSEAEIYSRCEILLENYCKILNIEALTMLEMARKEIMPAAIAYCTEVAKGVTAKKEFGIDITKSADKILVDTISELCDRLYEYTEKLDDVLMKSADCSDTISKTTYFRDNILTSMQALRDVADKLESIVSAKYWPYPTYGDLLFSV